LLPDASVVCLASSNASILNQRFNFTRFPPYACFISVEFIENELRHNELDLRLGHIFDANCRDLSDAKRNGHLESAVSCNHDAIAVD
jgi:hypothetical protein